ncbi:uncharacterized protein Bfra_010635lf [Botrytis fragariae]|uniref:RING-type domain-containing protein n=1 Tax=Botrytis fragariae TaxID=1964551 RepID=A0A8H6AI24_9HELO|nr:uncharacterized protein Bfra_010635lf [Botrytis fragariae]KAF5867665.1 hypothetical protein Bfra_010635lf [Botrytis fragariae]
MDPLDVAQAEGTAPIFVIAEREEGNAAVHLDRYYLLGDDLRIQLSNTGVLPDRIPIFSLPADVANRMRQEEEEIQDEDIPALEEERSLESTNMKKDAIRAVLKPVERSTDELSPCFCNEPYADSTAKIDNDSHEPVKMPDCPHIFGKCCIVQWLGDNNPSTCPMCRRVVNLPRDRPVTRNETDDVYSIIDYHY